MTDKPTPSGKAAGRDEMLANAARDYLITINYMADAPRGFTDLVELLGRVYNEGVVAGQPMGHPSSSEDAQALVSATVAANMPKATTKRELRPSDVSCTCTTVAAERTCPRHGPLLARRDEDDAISLAATRQALKVMCESLDNESGTYSAGKLAERLGWKVGDLHDAGLQRIANALFEAASMADGGAVPVEVPTANELPAAKCDGCGGDLPEDEPLIIRWNGLAFCSWTCPPKLGKEPRMADAIPRPVNPRDEDEKRAAMWLDECSDVKRHDGVNYETLGGFIGRIRAETLEQAAQAVEDGAHRYRADGMAGWAPVENLAADVRALATPHAPVQEKK